MEFLFKLSKNDGQWCAKFVQGDDLEAGGCGRTLEKAIDGAVRALIHTIDEPSRTKFSCD